MSRRGWGAARVRGALTAPRRAKGAGSLGLLPLALCEQESCHVGKQGEHRVAVDPVGVDRDLQCEPVDDRDDQASESLQASLGAGVCVHRVPIAPQAVVNEIGDTALITRVADDLRAEALVRALSVASRNLVWVADHACSWGFDEATGAVVTNPFATVGARAAVVGMPTPSQWRTAKGIATLGPRHFGFDVEFVPVEERPRSSTGRPEGPDRRPRAVGAGLVAEDQVAG